MEHEWLRAPCRGILAALCAACYIAARCAGSQPPDVAVSVSTPPTTGELPEPNFHNGSLAPIVPAVAAPSTKSRSWAPLVVIAAVSAIALAVVGTSTSGGAGLYNYSLKQLAAQGSEAEGKEIKVAGKVKPGSVRGEPASSDFRFELDDGEGNLLTIAFPRLLPDPFEEGREAIVQGKLQNGVLHASNLTVKCPSRYADGQNLSENEQNEYYEREYEKHKAATKQHDLPAK